MILLRNVFLTCYLKVSGNQRKAPNNIGEIEVSKNAAKHRKNKWLDEDYDEYDNNQHHSKRKKTEKVEVRKEKDKTQSRFRQPTYQDLVSTYGRDEDWH